MTSMALFFIPTAVCRCPSALVSRKYTCWISRTSVYLSSFLLLICKQNQRYCLHSKCARFCKIVFSPLLAHLPHHVQYALSGTIFLCSEYCEIVLTPLLLSTHQRSLESFSLLVRQMKTRETEVSGTGWSGTAEESAFTSLHEVVESNCQSV